MAEQRDSVKVVIASIQYFNIFYKLFYDFKWQSEDNNLVSAGPKSSLHILFKAKIWIWVKSKTWCGKAKIESGI